jgi:hypothetical protein
MCAFAFWWHTSHQSPCSSAAERARGRRQRSSCSEDARYFTSNRFSRSNTPHNEIRRRLHGAVKPLTGTATLLRPPETCISKSQSASSAPSLTHKALARLTSPSVLSQPSCSLHPSHLVIHHVYLLVCVVSTYVHALFIHMSSCIILTLLSSTS